MRTALIPHVTAGPRTRAIRIRSECSRRIQQYCRDRVIELKLATKQFSYDFDFTSGGTPTRRSLVRFKTLLSRAIEKQLPYVEYTQKPFLEILGRSTFSITLLSRPVRYSGSYYEFYKLGTTPKRLLCEDSRFGKTVERYVQYLRYICLKHAVPISIHSSGSSLLSAESKARYYEILSSNYDALKTESPEVQYEVKIMAQIVYWSHLPYNDLIRANHPRLLSLDEFIANRLEHEPVSAVFSQSEWHSTNIADGSLPSSKDFLEGYSRYWVPEKVFYYLPQIISTLRTLTRKTSYVSSAFSIGAPEGS